uniref:Pre-mRNA splicing factor PRP6 n=1 Tax=Lotharella vacuolata TaxID=74820 RepID=A0A0H5BQU1_9EUKA|nr:pre-mRNA splicing factor PRP6 [Lotharella vacuolata]
MLFITLMSNLFLKMKFITNNIMDVKNNQNNINYNKILIPKNTYVFNISSKILKNIFKKKYRNESFWKILLENYNSRANNNLYLFFVSMGIENCPTSEYLWSKYIENAAYDVYKLSILKAVKILPTNYKIWKLVIDKCNDEKEKQKLLLKSLKNIPNNNILWRLFLKHTSVELYSASLYKAIGCCPNDIELWKLLITAKGYFDSKKILNTVRKINPMKVEIWLMAACLEETYGFVKNSYKLIKKCFIYYHDKNYNIDMELFDYVTKLEKMHLKFFNTFKIIIKFIIIRNIKNKFFLDKWLGVLYNLNPKNNPIVIEEILKNIYIIFPNNYVLTLYLLSYFIYIKKIQKFEKLLKNSFWKNTNFELLWIIIFNYYYERYENINTFLLFKKFYIKKYHLNFIIIYLTNVFKYREVCKFFASSRIFIMQYSNIRYYIKIQKNYVNFVINNFLELHFDMDKNQYIFVNDLNSKYLFIIHFMYKKKSIIDLLYAYKKLYDNPFMFYKIVSIIAYKKKIKCLKFFKYIFLYSTETIKNKSILIDYFKKNFKEKIAFSITISLLKQISNSYKLWKELIHLGKNKIEKLFFVLLFENILKIKNVFKIIAKFLWASKNYQKSRKIFLRIITYHKTSIIILINILLLEVYVLQYKNSNLLIKITKKIKPQLPKIIYLIFSYFTINQLPSRMLYYFSIYLLKNKLKMQFES